MFLIFTTQPYSCLCNHNAIVFIFEKREVLQQEYSQPIILPSPHFRWVVNFQTPNTHIRELFYWSRPPPPLRNSLGCMFTFHIRSTGPLRLILNSFGCGQHMYTHIHTLYVCLFTTHQFTLLHWYSLMEQLLKDIQDSPSVYLFSRVK